MSKGMNMLQPVLQFFNNSGQCLSGGTLTFYIPGTTTLKNTYTTSDKSVANSNPVTLDNAGRPISGMTPIDIYLDGQYKLVVKDSAGNAIRTQDPITTLGQLVQTRNTSSSGTITVNDRDFIIEADASAGVIELDVLSVVNAGDGFQFSVQKIDSSNNAVTIQFHGSEQGNAGNSVQLTSPFQFLRFTCDGTQWIIETNNTLYGQNNTVVVDTSVVPSAVNHIRIGNAATGNDPVIAAVGTDANVSLDITPQGLGALNLTNGALNLNIGANIASAATTPIGLATGNFVSVTGTTTITAFDVIKAGVTRKVEFAGALILTYNATSLILPGAANITTTPGDIAEFVSLGGGNWLCTSYTTLRSLPLTASQSRITLIGSTTTFTRSVGCIGAVVEVLGAGGGGGGVSTSAVVNIGGGGGGSGNYIKSVLTPTDLGATALNVTIGLGGAAGFAANNGTAGGNTTFVSATGSLIANGGSGGNGQNSNAGGAAILGGLGGVVSGTVSTGTVLLNIRGNSGGGSLQPGASFVTLSGRGADSHYGSGGAGVTSNAIGLSAAGFGAGGSGGNASGNSASEAGGSGASGLVIITETILTF